MLTACNIEKKFMTDSGSIRVLKGVSLEVEQGEFVSIVGRSGSGKTTLLNVLSTLVEPDSGELNYRGRNVCLLSEKERNSLRRSDFGVIFQFHHLLPYLTVLENSLLPFMRSFRPVKKSEVERAKGCLDRVGLGGKMDRLPGSLSGGEQQRVAIARALVQSSEVLFADEPTGSLDRDNGEQVMELLEQLNHEGMSVVLVTHDPEYATRAGRTVTLADGRVVAN